jgi:hypothetical protein
MSSAGTSSFQAYPRVKMEFSHWEVVLRIELNGPINFQEEIRGFGRVLAVSVAVILVLRAALGDSNFLLEKNINVMKLKIMLLNSPCRSP